MTRRLLGALTALLAGALLVTGCAEIPRTSAVRQGPDIQNGLASDYLYYSPSGPLMGESKADILSGFLNASTGPQNDYGIAREYLAPDFRAKWSPNQQVYIQRGGQKIQFGPKGAVQLSIGVSAVVDGQGHYSVRPAGTTQNLSFKMALVNGQWRITEAPNAVVMIRPVFEVIFHSYAVYYFDRTYNYLVPDLRWFPARASTATRLVSAILAGPSKWLSDAIAPAMPSGTKLAIDSVTVDKKTAVVNLSVAALQASRLQKQRFKAELTATLTQLSGVSKVQVQIANAIQKIDDFSPASTSSGAYAPVVLAASQLQQLVGPSGSRLANANQWVTTLGVTDFAVTADQTSVAMTTKTGIFTGRLDQSEKAPVLVDKRTGILPPRFDRRGQLWMLGADGLLQVLPSTGKAGWYKIHWLKDHTVKAFTVSPDGARVAMIVADSKGRVRIQLAAVVRNRLGIVSGFGSPIELAAGVGSPTALEWAGKTGLLVLSDIDSTQSDLTLLTIGGDPREISTLDHAYGLMTSDDGSNIYVLDSRRRVMQYRGYTWTLLDQDVLAAHMVN